MDLAEPVAEVATGKSDVCWVKDTISSPRTGAGDTSSSLSGRAVAGQSRGVPWLRALPPVPLRGGTAGTDPAAWHLYVTTPVGQSRVIRAAELSFKYLPCCGPGRVTLVANVQLCTAEEEKPASLHGGSTAGMASGRLQRVHCGDTGWELG